MFVARDITVVFWWSILDEFIELSFQHFFPHFRECWWDHLLTDGLISNMPGIFIGNLFHKLLLIGVGVVNLIVND